MKRFVNKRSHFRGLKCDQEKIQEDDKIRRITIQIQCMKNVKTKVIPVTTKAIGSISK
jgi:hypothetical protein